MILKSKAVFYIVFLLSCRMTSAQPYSQFRMKVGTIYSIPTPGLSKGYAYVSAEYPFAYMLYAFEFNKPLKNGKGAWFIGFSFEPTWFKPAANKKNVTVTPGNHFSAMFGGDVVMGNLYFGFEYNLNKRSNDLKKNYFSFFSGTGIAFSTNIIDGFEYTIPGPFTTKKGETVEPMKSYTKRNSFPLSPIVIGGLRYNITNKKGNIVLILELLGHYGLTRYYNDYYNYKLDGIPKTDIMGEKGLNVQFNAIIPIRSFNKKKKIAASPI